jgi:cell division protein FtsB
MRLLIALLAAAFALLQFRLWMTDGGLREVWRLQEQVALRTEENRLLAERNAALEAEVRDLKRGLAAAEERARSELGMVLPDESFFQIVDSSAGDAAIEMPKADAPTAEALTRDASAPAAPDGR